MEILQTNFAKALSPLLLFPLLAISFVSCNPNNTNPSDSIGSIGIIDYLEIQNRVGIAEQNREKLEAFDAARDKSLAELLVSLREQAKPLENKLSAEKDATKIAQTRNTLKELNQQYFSAQQAWAQKRDRLVKSMGNAIIKALEPAMQAVCDQRGLKVIMIKGDREGYVSPDVEMTDEVVDEWKRNPINPVYDDSNNEDFAFPKIGN